MSAHRAWVCDTLDFAYAASSVEVPQTLTDDSPIVVVTNLHRTDLPYDDTAFEAVARWDKSPGDIPERCRMFSTAMHSPSFRPRSIRCFWRMTWARLGSAACGFIRWMGQRFVPTLCNCKIFSRRNRSCLSQQRRSFNPRFPGAVPGNCLFWSSARMIRLC